ncbi:helix-turn-helix domain-containing protein [Clostridium perfringens]|uniref:helix-turn-helix domain-containing protein n=1 Tax=Clostridium perfringens TaxID=1502 RepID=UPI001ABBB0B4|nr:helix-turn-helix transcriptional regulator [Clostridium perfringens]EHK2357044.1 helix-turn-helix transcriptional regulator [Clostridium perfringens]MBO3363296.1 helix-turn-helix transcriptional regulator [Clostridium perfringens]
MKNNIKIARIKKGWNQRKLSEISGVGITSITKIEKHGIDHVKVSTLKKLAAALDTTVQELFFSDEE